MTSTSLKKILDIISVTMSLNYAPAIIVVVMLVVTLSIRLVAIVAVSKWKLSGKQSLSSMSTSIKQLLFTTLHCKKCLSKLIEFQL